LRVIFLGTPEFAVPTLQQLIDFPHTDVVAVVTQPDRPSGRGNKMHAPPTKVLAEKHNIKVFQPAKLSKSPEIVQAMRDLQPDLIVMVAFGQILKKEVLNMPPKGVINVHASLLPKLRGAAPLNWSIINGDTIAGVTTMFTEAGVDTGPMLLKKHTNIDNEMNAEQLARILAVDGAYLLIETIQKLLDGTLVAERQDDSQATLAPMLDKELGRIKWDNSAKSIHDLVRGIVPWPGAFTIFNGAPLKIWKTKVGAKPEQALAPGSIQKAGDKIYVVCGDGSETLELLEVQPPSKAKMHARDWANGAHIKTGDVFTTEPGADQTAKAARVQSAKTAGDQSAMTAGDRSAMTAGGQSAMTAGGQSAMTAGGQSAMTADDRSATTAGDRSAGTLSTMSASGAETFEDPGDKQR
jgi:methionyl-tRNA formyltransferase